MRSWNLLEIVSHILTTLLKSIEVPSTLERGTPRTNIQKGEKESWREMPQWQHLYRR